MFTMVRGWTLLIFEVRGEKVKVTIDKYGDELENKIETKPLCFSFRKLSRDIRHCERMDPIEFGGQRLKVKVRADT